MPLTRRRFVAQTGVLGAVSLTGVGASQLWRAPAAGATTDHTLVCVFLRGAADGLSALVPHTDPDYRAARPSVAVTSQQVLGLDDGWGLHPALEPLLAPWNDGHLAMVPAAGSPDPSRSHFSAMDTMEAGTPGDLTTPTGWLARHLAATGTTGATLATVAMGRMAPRSLLGHADTVTVADLDTAGVDPHDTDPDALDIALRGLYTDPPDTSSTQPTTAGLVRAQGGAALGVIDALATADLGPAPDLDRYGPSELGLALADAARLVTAGAGVRIVCADHGHWDLHDEMGDATGGAMTDQLDHLARALRAFWDDTAEVRDRVTVVVMTEFGRRVAENSSGGTDHGHGSVLLALGGRVAGGIHGDWQGLGPDVLDRGDVPVLNDYRRVLAEILDRLLGTGADLATVFPGIDLGPDTHLGIVA